MESMASCLAAPARERGVLGDTADAVGGSPRISDTDGAACFVFGLPSSLWDLESGMYIIQRSVECASSITAFTFSGLRAGSKSEGLGSSPFWGRRG